MIIVNYWREKGSDPDVIDGYTLHLAAVVNDALDLHNDIDLITDAIQDDLDFDPKEETLYEIQLERATIDSDPIPEPAFAVVKVIEKQ